MNNRTALCLTVDTEFDIAGAFSNPDRNRPKGLESVWWTAGGEDQGLGFILRTLKAYGVTATFFVETLNRSYFGDGPMGSVVERLLEQGEDIQLHLHPCWLAFDNKNWRREVLAHPPGDTLSALPFDELVEVIGQGVERLQQWGAKRPVALRSGNLDSQAAIYRAMAKNGLKLASHIGTGYNPPGDVSLQLLGGRQWIEGVMEVPVTSYTHLPLSGQRRLRLWAITACSCQEMESLLWSAREQGVSTLVVITHPSEFIKRGAWGLQKNSVNQTRLAWLCRFVADHPEAFEMVNFGAAAEGWLQAGERPEPTLTAPLASVVARMVENSLNDLLPWY
ncbi:MAG: polysaccharide deacetylase [Magnetococcales bacterium]|nr:polysaccharide deacetylase [Magnetococcales bacterium]